jgi:hypothetical protein
MQAPAHARVLWLIAAMFLASCGGGNLPNVPPPPPSIPGVGVFDESASACSVSYDGFVHYSLPVGSFSPIDVRTTTCGAQLGSTLNPPIPHWAVPSGPTQAIFVATSLQQTYSFAGMQMLEQDASALHVPMTWMIGNGDYLMNAATYNQYHAQNGDDVETGEIGPSVATLQTLFPWYAPHVSVDGAGKERYPSTDIAAGFGGFWGITWDSRGIDHTDDMGAPWGEYCADPASYKRPAPSGGCSFLAYEWTARDLTRAYLSGLDYWFSTDPDDILMRAGFTVAAGAQYERQIVDAYAAAGQTTPLVMMSQQESSDEGAQPQDDQLMTALYQQAAKDGMRFDTFATVNADARAFAAAPRAIAFPYLAGGDAVPSPVIGGGTLYPATIDYHDSVAGMTFLAGHTMPARVFEYAADPLSTYDVPLAQLPASQSPTLTNVAAGNGVIAFAFQSVLSMHYGVALWTDPATLHLNGPGVTVAGRAGVVLTFQLQPGANSVSFPCAGCNGTTFTYST